MQLYCYLEYILPCTTDHLVLHRFTPVLGAYKHRKVVPTLLQVQIKGLRRGPCMLRWRKEIIKRKGSKI